MTTTPAVLSSSVSTSSKPLNNSLPIRLAPGQARLEPSPDQVPQINAPSMTDGSVSTSRHRLGASSLRILRQVVSDPTGNPSALKAAEGRMQRVKDIFITRKPVLVTVGTRTQAESQLGALHKLQSLGFPVVNASRVGEVEDGKYGIWMDRVSSALPSTHPDAQKRLNEKTLASLEELGELFKTANFLVVGLELSVERNGSVVISHVSHLEERVEPLEANLLHVDALRRATNDAVKARRPIPGVRRAFSQPFFGSRPSPVEEPPAPAIPRTVTTDPADVEKRITDPVQMGERTAILSRDPVAVGRSKKFYQVESRDVIAAMPREKLPLDDAQERVEALTTLAAKGFPVVNVKGIVQFGDEFGLLVESIPGAKRLTVHDKESISRLNANSFADLALIKRLLVRHGLRVVNLKLMIKDDGHIVLSDPLRVENGQCDANLAVIDRLMQKAPIPETGGLLKVDAGKDAALAQFDSLKRLEREGFPVVHAYRVEEINDRHVTRYGIRTEPLAGASHWRHRSASQLLNAGSLTDIDAMDQLFKETKLHAEGLDFLVKPNGKVAIWRVTKLEQRDQPSEQTLNAVGNLRSSVFSVLVALGEETVKLGDKNEWLLERFASGASRDFHIVRAMHGKSIVAMPREKASLEETQVEFRALQTLKEKGFPVVDVKNILQFGNEFGISMEYIPRAIRLKEASVNRLNERSFNDFSEIRTSLVKNRIQVKDPKFLVKPNGHIVFSGAGGVAEGISFEQLKVIEQFMNLSTGPA